MEFFIIGGFMSDFQVGSKFITQATTNIEKTATHIQSTLDDVATKLSKIFSRFKSSKNDSDTAITGGQNVIPSRQHPAPPGVAPLHFEEKDVKRMTASVKNSISSHESSSHESINRFDDSFSDEGPVEGPKKRTYADILEAEQAKNKIDDYVLNSIERELDESWEETSTVSEVETTPLETGTESSAESKIVEEVVVKEKTIEEKVEIFEKKIQVFLENKDSAEAYKQGTSIINKLKYDPELEGALKDKNPDMPKAFAEKYIPLRYEHQMNKFMGIAKKSPERALEYADNLVDKNDDAAFKKEYNKVLLAAKKKDFDSKIIRLKQPGVREAALEQGKEIMKFLIDNPELKASFLSSNTSFLSVLKMMNEGKL